MPAVAKIFPAEKRSWVLGVVGASSSFGSFAILPIGQHFITTTGWSNTSIIIGIIILIMIPLAMVFVRSTPQKTVELESKSTLRDALSEAFSHPSFWFLCGGFFVCGFHVVFIATHLPSYVVDLGFSATTGAWALAIIGLANVVGGYSAGVLGGKYSKKYLLSSLYFGRSLVMIGFILLPPSELGIYIFAVVMGLFWLSTVPLTSGLVADMYGVRHMSTLFGLVFFSHQLGAFLGGWLGGYFYDSTGSYNIVWWISVVLGIISALAHWPIKPLPQRQLTPAI
jgi:predicted MFS family arabinose efflux permease